ncbi:substrate-binding domain-containing protein [Microbacterium sp. LRZ72]|uniref:LacI family DNA-binding transcriptional regulator n=1 Tax=Microbacterium sp. LRZ72 TaxID=2942481 RepID=UPI0029BAB3F0|nr:substrate-binding domain-containing protein [Microbacterium sp. LRZ72]MDX2376266.1 substrate-binding domain-containing protein [Microbacterium sp. LRZ72]
MATGRPTIADVAREAGVSPSTASVVFSGKAPVADATRRRVRAASDRLGYTGPDPRAASLRRGRSGVVGVVFEERLGAAFLDPVKTLMMDGLAEGVAPLGAGLLLLRDEVPASTSEPAPPAEPALSLETALVDAVVLVGASGRLAASLEILRARGIPVVVIEGDAGAGIPRIDLDNLDAQRQAAEHLRRLGHEHVAIVTLPWSGRRRRGLVAASREDDPSIDVTRERLRGAREVYPDATVFETAASLIDEGWEAGAALLRAVNPPTAVIAQSDLLAAGVIRAAEECGLRVPQDLSVTGFDGIALDGFAPYELTTLAQPAAAKGRAAADAVVRMLSGEDAASVRFSCAFRHGNTSGLRPRLD